MALDSVLRKLNGASVPPVPPVPPENTRTGSQGYSDDSVLRKLNGASVPPVPPVPPENTRTGSGLDYTLADVAELDSLINAVCDRQGYSETARQAMLDARRKMMPALMVEQLHHFRELMAACLAWR